MGKTQMTDPISWREVTIPKPLGLVPANFPNRHLDTSAKMGGNWLMRGEYMDLFLYIGMGEVWDDDDDDGG